MIDPKKIDGAELQALRKEAGFTSQERFGELLGISRETVHAIENNKVARDVARFDIIQAWWLLCQKRVSERRKKRFASHLLAVLGLGK